ncbi:carbonic anhydrase 1-like [Clupea harengus]|uniref:Carbonic anhydrase n=1 Tax=Clupea harengus TaxID=7950 RepID=A0A6P8EZS5_CLUHA|nr:carbonic anhydrase 1-like [Clupea harengus]XP_031417314.1 carbonic anhydrase 1-like [Clupea harengus]XP_031417315.1 carbonic anhydrase 1-like [Clupea harengus]
MHSLYLITVLACLLPSAFGDGSSVAWCYHLPTCNDATWPTIVTDYCNGSRQSPIDIISANIEADLGAFTFTGFDDNTTMSKIKNTGKTVKIDFKTGKLSVSGGALSTSYDTLQFHLHWGNQSSIPGSEHTVDGKRYPMELHIVNIKSTHNGNVSLAVEDSEGLAALGFFIEVDPGTTDQPESWRSLASHLANIIEEGHYVNITGISMNDLISGVDTASYYRYLGSLTTPNCNEAVIWTVFKDTVKVSQNLIDLFSTTVRIGDSSSPLMVNVFRNVQPLNGREVTATTAPSSKATTTFATKSLMALGLAALYSIFRLG